MTAATPDSGSVGRDVRLAVGILLVLGNLALVALDALNHEPVTTQDVILHAALLVGGLLLIDPSRTMDLIGVVKDKLPFVGSGPQPPSPNP